MSDDRKPRSRGKINPSHGEMVSRHIGRIPRLREAIEKAESRGNTDKVTCLQVELDRRLAEVADIKAKLDSI